MSVAKRNIEDELAANAAEPDDDTPADDKPEPDPQEPPTEDDMATEKIEDTPDEQQPEQPQEFEIKDTPQGGVSVPAGESEDPNASIEEKQAKQQEQITAAIQSVRDLLRATGPSREADLAIMKLDEAESWASKSVVA